MPYTKTDWDETTAITVARLNNQEDGIGDVEDHVDAQVAIANQNILDAKTPLASAITNKGVTTATTSTFTQMATNIGAITAVKSIQQGIFVASNASGSTRTLALANSVNISKSIIIAERRQSGSNGFFSDWLWSFTSSTEITLTRNTSSSTTSSPWTYVYAIVEFHDWVKVLTGQNNLTINGENNITISSVDPTKSFAVCTNRSSSNGVGGNVVRAFVKSSTTLTLEGSNDGTARWFVVDFSGV
jgi:hypothetical protein